MDQPLLLGRYQSRVTAVDPKVTHRALEACPNSVRGTGERVSDRFRIGRLQVCARLEEQDEGRTEFARMLAVVVEHIARSLMLTGITRAVERGITWFYPDAIKRTGDITE